MLIAWWKLDDADPAKIADSSGYGLDSWVEGGVTVGKPGFVGTAAEFDGQDGTFLPIVPKMIPAVFETIGQFTIEAYVKPDPAGLGKERYVVDTSYSKFSMSIHQDGYVNCRWFPAGMEVQTLTSKNKVADDKWHHVACVRHIENDLTPKMAVFIDGMVDNAVVDSSATIGLVAGNYITLGGMTEETNALLGSLDEVKIYFKPAMEHAKDSDEDGILDVVDNCPGTPNHGQADGNDDNVGDACTDLTGTPCLDAAQCDDGNACTQDACMDGLCSYSPTDLACSDLDPFTVKDACVEGQCKGAYVDLVVDMNQDLLPGHHFYKDVTVESGKILTCKGDTSTYYGMGCIIHAQNVTVASSGRISADYEGFPKGAGPGLGCGPSGGVCGGGGHGGAGGSVNCGMGPPYGSAKWPVELGSGGACTGSGGNSGGAIAILATDGVVVGEDGTVSATGAYGNLGGGGSGGSVAISATSVAGAGTISANGGDGYATSGGADAGGGRVAIIGDSSTFAGKAEAKPGTNSASPGKPGTVYIAPPGQ
jgi:hypothetical protein